MRWTGFCYRAHNPRWAWTPLSGAGAALKGGRFNPIGVPALYLALTIEGMFCEMSHGFSHIFEPLTVCTYRVDVSDIVDVRTKELRAAAGVSRDQLACAWEYDASKGRRAASWLAYDGLTAAGAAGILVPSFARGARDEMHSLVLWDWSGERPHKVEVYDPLDRLPKNPQSWE